MLDALAGGTQLISAGAQSLSVALREGESLTSIEPEEKGGFKFPSFGFPKINIPNPFEAVIEGTGNIFDEYAGRAVFIILGVILITVGITLIGRNQIPVIAKAARG